MDATRAFVIKILERATSFEWSLQGFGMLRLHLDDDYRLNVWDSAFRVKNVSLLHTHPWNFESQVVCGRLSNWRYKEAANGYGAPFLYATIKPGPGGGLLNTKGEIWLTRCTREVIEAGETYRQKAYEIHQSDPEDGTVTLNKRTRIGDDVANVYWPCGEQWVSAEPRAAYIPEISKITLTALNKMRDETDKTK